MTKNSKNGLDVFERIFFYFGKHFWSNEQRRHMEKISLPTVQRKPHFRICCMDERKQVAKKSPRERDAEQKNQKEATETLEGRSITGCAKVTGVRA